MTAVTLARAETRPGPRSFAPPLGRAGDRAARLSHLDPRPLWLEPVPAESPWKSASFYVACAIVLPVAAVVAPVRALLRLL